MSRALAVALVAIGLGGLFIDPADAIEWTRDWLTTQGWCRSLAVTNYATYMTFQDPSTNLWLGHRGACSWSFSGIDSTAVSASNSNSSVAGGPGGAIGVAYLRVRSGSYRLWYARVSSYGSLSETNVSTASVGGLSMKIDADGVAHIAFYDDGDLKYVTVASDMTVGTSVVVASGSDAGHESNSIALDSEGNPWIAYTTFDGNWYTLRLAHRTGGSWSSAVVNSTNGCRGCSLALNADSNPRISYQATNRQTGLTWLGYASWNGSTWTFTAASTGEVQEWTALALDGNGLARVAAWDWTRAQNSAVATYFYEQSQGTWQSSACDTVTSYIVGASGPVSIGVNSAGYGVLGFTAEEGHLLSIACAEAAGGAADTTAPGAIDDLAVAGRGPHTLIFTWSAVGDDGSVGEASNYDIRYSTSSINESNFYSANPVVAPCPETSGTAQCVGLGGLNESTQYYVAMKVRDNAGNWSEVSNCASGVTTDSGMETLCEEGARARPSLEEEGGSSGLTLRITSANPTRESVGMWFTVPAGAGGRPLRLGVYDAQGRCVRVLASGAGRAGGRAMMWDLRTSSGGRVQSGVYFVRLQAGELRALRSIVVLP